MGAQQRQKRRVTLCQSWKGLREGQRVSPYPQGRSPAFGLPLPSTLVAPRPLTAPPHPPQINLNESMQVVSRKVVTVAYGEPVHHVMQFDPADPGYLYLMTSHQVRPEPRSDEVPGRAELSWLPCLCACCCCCWGRLLPYPRPARPHLPAQASPLQGSLVPCVSPIIASSLSFPSFSQPSPC